MSQDQLEPHYLRTKDAAKFVGLSVSTMTKMRCRGDGPVFRKAGRKAVVYARSDLENWLAAGRRRSTSDEGTIGLPPGLDASMFNERGLELIRRVRARQGGRV